MLKEHGPLISQRMYGYILTLKNIFFIIYQQFIYEIVSEVSF